MPPLLTPLPPPQDEVLAECADMRWGTFKPLLADALVAHLEPIQARYNEAIADPTYLDGVLARGAEAAAETANATLASVRDAMGFVPPARKF
jgi:tryptophanyl-tRNA synthetase